MTGGFVRKSFQGFPELFEGSSGRIRDLTDLVATVELGTSGFVHFLDGAWVLGVGDPAKTP